MIIKVLYFAQLSEKLGINSEEIEVDEGSTSDNLIKLLVKNHPELDQLEYQIAVNQSLIKKPTPLENGSEIALLPPFAGG